MGFPFSLRLARAGLLLGLAAAPALTAAPEARWHVGMANASAGVPLGAERFVAASDEQNRLIVYRLEGDGRPVAQFDLNGPLQLAGAHSELDLEGAALLGDVAYWLGSHGRNKDGKSRPDRQRLLATRITTNAAGGVAFELVGRPATRLLTQLQRDPQLAGLQLERAGVLAPDDGGINLEGLAATADGQLLLGFRGPLVKGRAAVVPLRNPAAVMAGHRAEFGPPRLLDLGGRGIRDLVWTGREYFLIGGGSKGGGKPRLFRWAGDDSAPVAVELKGLKQFNPEALIAFGTPERPRLLVLSDDGKAAEKTGAPVGFRSFWLEP
jgi:hypothetical protein